MSLFMFKKFLFVYVFYGVESKFFFVDLMIFIIGRIYFFLLLD